MEQGWADVREHSEQEKWNGPAVPRQGGPPVGEKAVEAVDPTASEVTRLLCQALHERVDRVRLVKEWWRNLRGRGRRPAKPRRSTRRRIFLEGSDDCPPLGEPMAQWVVDHVLRGPRLPVPAYGFDLLPVVVHSLRARRQRRIRRTAVLLGIALIAAVAPASAAVWAAALLVTLLLWWAAFRAVRKGKVPKSRLARSPRLILLVLCLPWLIATVPFEESSGDLVSTRVALVCLPFAWLTWTAIVCVIDRIGARAAVSRIARDGVTAVRFPRATVKGRNRLQPLKEGQLRQELPYDDPERFVGAGRDVWGTADITIPLKSKDPKAQVELPGESELLDGIGTALKELGGGDSQGTDALPGFSVQRVVGLPSALWLARTQFGKPSAPDLRGRGRRSPSSVPDRLYLRAQCVSWSGQIVVTVFVHAAFEAGELRLTVRPHVMTPLYSELLVAGWPSRGQRLRFFGRTGVHGLLDAADAPLALFRFVKRLALKEQASVGRREEKDPVSLRDRYAREEVTDMHQSDDAKRHVVLMQTCVFRAVAEHLKQLGIDTTGYEEQVSMVINNIQVYGDNNAPIQNVVGSGISNVGQGT
ncbi:hypothetical protein [Streptomyces sp. NPDC053541]|uniref:hypothetical protein n=1 Tax=Streptomyces sp. NPDC053541 TaxID=3365709 RepID=UPI0037D022F8